MPIAYIYGNDVYIVDVVFDKRDKKITQPIVAERIRRHSCRMGRFEGNVGGDAYADDIQKALNEWGYRCNITVKKANNKMSKARRIEQYAPDIKNYYFLDDKHRSDEYRRFMNELTSYSFTGRNTHDDARDSLAGFTEYHTSGVKKIGVFKRIF